MVRKISSIIALLLLIIFLSIIGLYINNQKINFDNIKFNYISIENTYFDYSIDNNGTNLSCDIDTDTIISKGSNIKLKCKDDYFSFINFNRNIKVENVLTVSIDKNRLEALIKNSFDHDIYYKVNDSITIINIIQNENKTYQINVYDDVYYDGESLKTYDIKKDNFVIQDLKLTIQEDDISYYRLNEKINAYLNSGYIKITD